MTSDEMPVPALPYHRETGAFVLASPDRVFDYLDDPRRLAGHMAQSSAMMFGSRFAVALDEGAGRVIGSSIRMAGRLLGIRLFLEEVISEREPPRLKVWHTIGSPRLLVLAQYRMGFEVVPHGSGSQLRVFIDFQRPERGVARLLGWLFGALYARWCTRRMVRDAVIFFHRSDRK
jgi:hypothetical protein